uniref:Poly(3-hydroxyalkanoate) polymerase subunit PhaE n=1 Tax=Candidatus Kentrum sp. LFY TaxID=2126342 RepID=A0A450UFU3_9GAMM|nr:MAG: poly(R)-hydroxyalkanoic acid synthase, class III, PhaE subunit [Candidatus Kentron sp. LFY]
MNQTEQTESMMKMWSDVQKQFMGGWYDLAQGMSGLPGVSATPDLSQLMNWFKPGFMPGFTGGTGGATDARAAAGNLLSTQAMMMQAFGMLTRAWQAASSNASESKPWGLDFDTFLKQWSNELISVPGRFSTTGTDMKELMGSFLGEWGPLLKPWLASMQGMGLGGPMTDILMGEQLPFQKMFGTGAEPAFQDLAQIPMMGVSREQMAKISRAFDSHVDLRKALHKYQTAMAKGIAEAMKETMEKLVELARKDEKISNVRELISLWVKTTDKKLTQMYVTDEFTVVQAEMSKASLDNKRAQRAVLEMILTQFDIPTRTELDDAYKTLYNLKKEVRELRTDTVDVRNGHKQAEAEMMEMRNARKRAEVEAMEMRSAREQAESEAAELRSKSKKLESELASLRDAMQKMETKLGEDIAKAVKAIKTPEPARSSGPAAVDTKAPPRSAAPPPKPAAAPPGPAAGPTEDKGKEAAKAAKKKPTVN